MENAKLLITFACPPEIRKIIEDLVGNRLTPLYFTDLKESDIDQAAHADYVLALNLHQEIPETILEKAQWSFCKWLQQA